MIEGLFAVRKNNFADFPALESELDLVDADDQITHELSLDDQIDPGDLLISLSLPNFDMVETVDSVDRLSSFADSIQRLQTFRPPTFSS